MAIWQWTGGSADWTNVTDWNLGSVPGASSTASITSGGSYTLAVGAADNASVLSLTINAPIATLEVDGILNVAAPLQINAGTVAVKGALNSQLIVDNALLAYVGNHTVSTSIDLGGTSPGSLQVQDANATTPATLTLSSTALIVQTGTSAVIGSTTLGGETVVNQGRILASLAGGGLTIAPLHFINSGLISASNGNMLTLGGQWSNSGTITLANGAGLTLGGSFTTNGIGSVLGSGGGSIAGVTMTGILNNADATLSVGAGAVLGTVTLVSGAAINGGGVADFSGNGFMFAGGTLNGVTYLGPLNISGGDVVIANGLQVSDIGGNAAGEINLTGGGASIQFITSQTIDNVTINLNGDSNEIDVSGGNGTVLTLGPNAVVDNTAAGSQVEIRSAVRTQGALANYGTIIAAASQSSFAITPANGFANLGTISVSNGGSLLIQPGSGQFINGPAAMVSVASGSTLQIVGGNQLAPGIGNAGEFSLASGARLDLVGYYSLAALGTLVNKGAITEIDGTLDAAGATIALGANTALGSVQLNGAIRNATIVANGRLTIGGSAASLLDDAYQGPINLTAASGQLTVNEGVTFADTTGTLPGTVNVTGNRDVVVFSNLTARSSLGQTLDDLTLNIGNSAGADSLQVGFSGGTFTIGPHANIVSAANGALAGINAGASTAIVLDGTIAANGRGGTFALSGITAGAGKTTFNNNGTLIVSNGDTLSVATQITAGAGNGAILIGSGGVANFAGSVAADQTLTFSDGTGTLILQQPSSFAATIRGFINGTTIDLADIPVTTAAWTGDPSGLPGPIVLGNFGSVVATLSLLGNYTGATFGVGSDGNGGTDITTTAIVSGTCYAAGTRILTPRGEIAIERLHEGDLVLTVSGATQPIQWVGRRRVDFRHHPNSRRILPVRIAAHAFGPHRPKRDLLLSPDHAVFVDDVLIPIRHLVNGTTVAQIERATITYYHLELPRHDVVLAEGLPAESYLEAGARDAFANAGTVMQLHPDFAARSDRFAVLWETAGYAPLVVAGEPLDRVRRKLARQAAMLVKANIRLHHPASRIRASSAGVSARASAPAAANSA